MKSANTLTLNTLADVRQYFAHRERAMYFISPSNFNLMDMHRWVPGWININLLDCFDAQHANVVVIPDDHSRVFTGVEDVNHYLLGHPVVQEHIRRQQDGCALPAQAVFLFFDPALETLCAKELQLEIALPPHRLVCEVDSKIVTTEIGNQAGVASVPHVLAHVDSYATLHTLAQQAGLGDRWVVQAAYGDSGKTTYFIDCETDYAAVAPHIESQESVKVMRWVRCTGTAIEACATRWGTFVGPLLTELIGAPELTPYAGGWCGNELYAAAFSPELRAQVLQKTQAMGDALYQRGYRGYFELDYLIDLDTDAVYLGELNARITGITAMTNMSVFSQTHIPLFLFHLLEYETHVQLTLDVDAFNQSVLREGATGIASQLILKYTDSALNIVTQAPLSGVYRMQDDDTLALVHLSTNRLDAMAQDEVFVLRIMTQGDYAYKGGDLAILFLNEVIRTPQGLLNTAGQKWVKVLKNCFAFRNLTQEERALVELARNPVNVKSGVPQ